MDGGGIRTQMDTCGMSFNLWNVKRRVLEHSASVDKNASYPQVIKCCRGIAQLALALILNSNCEIG